MLNHPVTSVQNGARWRQEDLLRQAAQDQQVASVSEPRVRWGLAIVAVLLAVFGSRGN